MNQTSAAGAGPVLRPFGPAGPRRDLPVAQKLGCSGRGEDGGQGADQRGNNLVPRQAAVAIGELVRGRLAGVAGRDHERRVGHHQLEFLARNRFQQRPEPEAHAGVEVGRVQVQLGGVEQEVEPGERQGAFGDVRGGHVLGVVEQVKGLNAAAGAKVEGPGDMPAGGDLHQGGGGLPDPQDMVVPEDACALVGGEVAGHPEVRSAVAHPVVPSGRVPAVRP